MIRVKEKITAYDDIMQIAIEPFCINIKEERLREYLKENPMPIDTVYTEEDFIFDLVRSSEVFFTLPNEIDKRTQEYIEQALNDLIP